MVMALRSNLCQMGNAEHLVMPGKALQQFPYNFSNTAANACVHFIEYQRWYAFFIPADDLDRKADPGQFSARRNLAQWLWRVSRIHTYQKFHQIGSAGLRSFGICPRD